MARLTSVLLFAAAALPYAFATSSSSCGSGEFFFSERSCCLPHGGQPNPPSPPSGVTCPTNGWYWHTDNECCVPSTPQTPSSPAPSCESDCIWSSLDLHCKRQPATTTTPSTPTTSSTPTQPTSPATPSSSSDCQDGNFFFQPKSCCLPHGGQPNPPSPPSGVTCPTNGWYWHSDNQCCVPSTPQTPSSPAPSCEKDCIWSSLDLRCSPQSSSTTPAAPTTTPATPSSSSPAQPSETCGSSEFYFGDKQCCLPHGGQPNPPSPPSGVTCPTNGWYWHTGKQCCVPSTPQTPSSPPPQCEKGCNWSSGDLKCYPQPPTTTSTPPKPSGYAGHKRHAKSRAITLCPSPMTACPIKGLMSTSGDYECFDTDVELTSCGGCASTGVGQDCTAIPNVWNVACNKGQCQVTTCAQGFKPSSDAKSCISF